MEDGKHILTAESRDVPSAIGVSSKRGSANIVLIAEQKWIYKTGFDRSTIDENKDDRMYNLELDFE